jgi:hypothetical protein
MPLSEFGLAVYGAYAKARIVPQGKVLTVGRIVNRGENGAMSVDQAEVGLPGGICRMDGRRASATLHLPRHAR